MKRKQLISLALLLSLLLGLAAPVFGEEEPAPTDNGEELVLVEEETEEEDLGPYEPFPDVDGHWAQDVIEEWHRYGVIGGDTDTGCFRPDDSLSRAEFATLLNRVIGYPLLELRHFTDVPADAWYAETMSRLNAAGIILGDGNDMIRPKDPVTRQEASVILCRAFGIEEAEPTSMDFLDADQVSDWAAGSVYALYNMDAIHGWEGYFDPQLSMTRVQMVILLDNLIGAAMTRPGTWNHDVEGDMFVNTKRAVLENMTVSGDLIISDGVGSGDVTLSNVKVAGDLIVRGCGEKSLHIQPGFELGGQFILAKSAAGNMRVVNETGEPLPHIHITAGKSTVILEGDLTTVQVSCTVPVILRGSKAESLALAGPQSELTVEKGSTLTDLVVEKEAKDTEITVEGTVTTLTTNAAARVNNTGKITTAHAGASGLVLAGTRPGKITMASGVSRPKDGNGKTIPSAIVIGGGGGSYGGGGSSGGSSTPSYKGDINLTLTAPKFGEKPQKNATGTSSFQYEITSTEWQNEGGGAPTYRSDGAFTSSQKYQAVITLTLTPDPEVTVPPTESPEETESPSVSPTDSPEETESPSVTPTESPEETESPSVTPPESPDTSEPAETDTTESKDPAETGDAGESPDPSDPSTEPPAARSAAAPPAARAAKLYSGKALKDITVSLNGKRIISSSIVVDEEAGTLTCTYVFPATDKKNFIEEAKITGVPEELTEGAQVSAKVEYKDNLLIDSASYQYKWTLDGTPLEDATGETCSFEAAAGDHSLTCEISAEGYIPVTATASFTVKGTEPTTPPEETDPPGGGDIEDPDPTTPPGETDPEEPDPGETEPGETQPGETEPGETEPSTPGEPGPSEPEAA